ncbi:hypothetical protein BH11PSE11_BH11PSE11_04410 [soil metagenome]
MQAVNRWLWYVCVLMILLSDLRAQDARAANEAGVESQIKAAYLYKFGRFIEWPPATFARPGSTVRIGILGADPVADDLSRIVVNRTINDLPVTVLKMRRDDQPADFHMIFISNQEAGRLGEILAAVRGQPILIITESNESFSAGSMINLVTIDGKLRFDVALNAVEAGHLKLSALMLAAANRVVRGSS